MTEMYPLNWQTFPDYLQLMFKDLYEEGQHSDVTLVCEDQTHFKAHKIVLRACSPVFKKIIDNNPTQHSLILQDRMKSEDIFSTNIKVSSTLVMSLVIKLQKRVIFSIT